MFSISRRIRLTLPQHKPVSLNLTLTFSRNFFNMGSSSSTTSSGSDVSAAAFIDEAIKSNQVTIFSKSYCPYCISTKKTFAGLDNVTVKAFELDQMDNGDDIQRALATLTGQRTVPSVFVGEKHLGGNDDTQRAFQTGTIQEMLGLR